MFWPRTAPATVHLALAGLLVMVLVTVLNIVTITIIDPNGMVIVEDLVIVAAFLAIGAGICRRAPWARYAGIAVAALFAVGAASQFRGGIPAIVVAVGVMQLLVLVGVVVVLLLRPTSDWFRSGT